MESSGAVEWRGLVRVGGRAWREDGVRREMESLGGASTHVDGS